MKITVLVAAFVGLMLCQSATAIRCLECSGVSTEAECRANGTVRECDFNEDACHIELRRHEGWDGALRMYKHCKQSKACDDNYVQNPRAAWSPSQCNPDDFNSVCRCCCYTDECNVASENCFGQVGCTSLPSFISGGSLSCTNGRNIGSVCTITCNGNTNTVGATSTACRSDGTWSHPLPRCADVYCDRKPLRYGWYSCTDGHRSGSVCRPRCWPGYSAGVTDRITCGNDGNWIYPREPSCQPAQCPERAPVVGGTTTCSNGRFAQSRCRTRCDDDRRRDGIPVSYCQDNGEWSHDLPVCEEIQCVPRGTIISGDIVCSTGFQLGSICQVECHSGHVVVGPVESICLLTKEGGRWSNELPKCVRLQCPRRGKFAGGTVSCTDNSYVGSICTASCVRLTRLIGADVSECLPSGEWSAPLPTCERIVCPDRGQVAQGEVVCSRRNLIRSICTVRCVTGSRMIGDERSQCEPTGQWSNPLPQCQVMTCPALDFSSEAGFMTCTNGNLYKSVCRFTCDEGYFRSGTPRLRCSLQGRWNTKMPRCLLLKCPFRRRMRNGAITCTEDNNIGSMCIATCNDGFEQLGLEDTVCLSNGRWDGPLPFCSPITCSPRRRIFGGTVSCTNDNNFRSVCSVTCDVTSRLVGSRFSECTGIGEWDAPLPECERNPCPDQGELENGVISCTNGRDIGSVCSFECQTEDGYELYPPDRQRNFCGPTQLWSLPKPCCARLCPPYALMDMVIVLDSSSSIGAENWVSLTQFVRSIISAFTVASDAANIAIFRYNRVVDERTQIFLNSYPDDISALLNAFGRIPYDGSGTNTGNGLVHALDVSLSAANGNRPDVQDLVLVITDGKAGDNVKDPADDLRNAGATVLVLGIEPPRERLDRVQLTQIAGDPRNLVIASEGFAGLDASFALRLSRTICGEPCS